MSTGAVKNGRPQGAGSAPLSQTRLRALAKAQRQESLCVLDTFKVDGKEAAATPSVVGALSKNLKRATDPALRKRLAAAIETLKQCSRRDTQKQRNIP
jgi:hypothetical protein